MRYSLWDFDILELKGEPTKLEKSCMVLAYVLLSIDLNFIFLLGIPSFSVTISGWLNNNAFVDEQEINNHVSMIAEENKKSNKDLRMRELENWLNYLLK